MNTPRLEVHLGKLSDNVATLVERLAARGVVITGVTKASLGCPVIAACLLDAGVHGLGDSRIENIERMRATLGPNPRMTLIRSPMLSQIERVVRHADISFNTELTVVRALSAEATRTQKVHGVVLMVEMADLREGIMPDAVMKIVADILQLPNIALQGIGTNLACLSGTSPDAAKMDSLSALANAIEQRFSITLNIISGGNSANMDWVFGTQHHGRVNDLRLGEAILLGCEALNRTPIEGPHTDVFTLIGEVIEANVKPGMPWGTIAENSFGETLSTYKDCGFVSQAILAIGRQDCDVTALDSPAGMDLLGASSDHLVLDTHRQNIAIGAELVLGVHYGSLLRAMTSPFVEKALLHKPPLGDVQKAMGMAANTSHVGTAHTQPGTTQRILRFLNF